VASLSGLGLQEGFIHKRQAQGIEQGQGLLKPVLTHLLLIRQRGPTTLDQLVGRERNGGSLITRMRTQVRSDLPGRDGLTILPQEIGSTEAAGLGAGQQTAIGTIEFKIRQYGTGAATA